MDNLALADSNPLNALENLDLHDHLCLIYETQEEQFAAAIPFMCIGLERGEKCIYIADDNTVAAVLDAMRVEGTDVEAATQSGTLSVLTKQDAYLRNGYFDPDKGVHVNVNTALCEMTGFSREELIGVGPPHPYWPPEAYDEIEQAFQSTLRGEFDRFGLTFMRENGERFPVIVSPSWVRDDEGNVISYLATVKDITERVRAEEELRKHREHLEEIVEKRRIMNLMAGREVRMAELKKVIKKLRAQLEEAGLEPVADDPLLGGS